ncbi:MFS transporter [Penicillium herquei]|nr:MFS transporter [Penicillium herquei]
MDASGGSPSSATEEPEKPSSNVPPWRRIFGGKSSQDAQADRPSNYRPTSTLGILSDKQTDEVPGTVLLLSANRNEPLGMRHQPQRMSTSSLPTSNPTSRSSSRNVASRVKRTADGEIVLDPQPDDSVNDPLNWPVWQRDAALFSLGFYCLMGGGMTTILAAGFNDIAATYNVSEQKVAFTTGLYMMGLGLGSVVMSPTAILFGKRPVYLLGATLFILSGVWCALSPNYPSLVIARIFQGFAVSPVECLPSATIAEIYFLHERAYRVGIYTLLLLGGKNLIPLVSAAVIGSLGWRWVFWIVSMVVGACLVLLFFFVPETFWDRTPRPRRPHKRPHAHRTVSDLMTLGLRGRRPHAEPPLPPTDGTASPIERKHKNAHVGFANDVPIDEKSTHEDHGEQAHHGEDHIAFDQTATNPHEEVRPSDTVIAEPRPTHPARSQSDLEAAYHGSTSPSRSISVEPGASITSTLQYTNRLRDRPKVPYVNLLSVWNGRIARDKWIKIAARPFVLYAYPSVLWSAVVYALSVGWLIVISESISKIFESKETYGFTALQAGLIYISPFIGGLLGTAVAGKVSDIVVRFLTRRNGGIYEPEFRLVMAIPIALSTTIGLMGFGWSAQNMDAWIVPTIFFGLISFGCCLGSTTAITFCVDSYRQYAGEALVTLNFSKNVLHGLVFSLFIVDWLDTDGSRTVYLTIGGIQLFCLLMTIPMYMYGKRARMWTVRKRLMERL